MDNKNKETMEAHPLLKIVYSAKGTYIWKIDLQALQDLYMGNKSEINDLKEIDNKFKKKLGMIEEQGP